ncbi:hypothetical protein CTATCC11996_25091 [Comamonas testosteroni ATCC 11996]|nr:hypothetical protein CTATCC11996_25091 [Comamonas testosteroni ATCC 11996]
MFVVLVLAAAFFDDDLAMLLSGPLSHEPLRCRDCSCR